MLSHLLLSTALGSLWFFLVTTTARVTAFAPSLTVTPQSSSKSHAALLPSLSIRRQLHVPLSHQRWFLLSSLGNNDDDNGANEEAARLQQKAQELRDQIRKMEEKIGEERRSRYMSNNNDDGSSNNEEPNENDGKKSLKNKRVLILGANGRLGSMVTRHLLRNHPEVKEVVAAVHYVGKATRGYGRLSYEVGAEDGVGSIGPAWSSEDERNASFEYNPQVMDGYNLNKLRVVEVELLNPTQVRTITEDVDSIIFCATDFEGNRPRAVASLNAAFLFRAVADPLKGRVEIEGIRNCLEGLASSIKDAQWKDRRDSSAVATSLKTDPTQFILVSTSPDAFGEFETPFGEFNGLKRQGEGIVQNEFPSISYSVLQMGRFDERVEEGMELIYDDLVQTAIDDGIGQTEISNGGIQKRINRRDAARAAVEALLDENLERKTVEVYTATR